MSEAVARYLLVNGLVPKQEFEDGQFRTVALYSKNREEWVITDLACVLAAFTAVTLYDTLGKESLEYILDQTKIKTTFCSAEKIKSILDLKKESKVPSLTHVVYFDEAKQTDKDLAA